MNASLRARYGPLLPWAGLALGACLTLVGWLFYRRVEQARLEQNQKLQLHAMADRIQRRMQGLEQGLRAAAGFLARSPLPSRSEWHDYYEGLAFRESLPGVQGIGFVQWIPTGMEGVHLRALRSEGFPDYQVAPGGPLAPLAEGSSSIIYLEPMDVRNQRAFGRDMLTEAVRRQALLRARDTGLSALTGKVTLYQEGATDIQSGTLLFVPVYRMGTHPQTIAERRAAFLGWAYHPLRMDDLLRSHLAESLSRAAVELFDGPRPDPSAILFDSDAPNPLLGPMEGQRQSFEVAGRIWTLQVKGSPAFLAGAGSGQPQRLAIAGVMLSLLLFALLLVRQRAEGRANTLAAAREAALLASEAQFHALFEKSPLGMAIVETASGTYLEVNTAYTAILGYARHELLGRSFLSFTHPDSLPAALDSMRELDSGAVDGYQKEKLYLHKDGHPVVTRLHVVKLPSEPGLPKRQLSILEDITLPRQQEERRLASEERFRSLFELAPEPMVLVQLKDGVIALVNPAWCAMTGHSAAEALGRTGPDLGLWDQPEVRAGILRELQQQGQFRSRKVRMRRKDGSEAAVLWSGRRVELEGESLAIIVGKDVTEQERAEAALEARGLLLRAMFENSPVAMARAALDATVAEANPAFERLLGRPKESFLGRSIQSYTHPEDWPRDAGEFRALAEGERAAVQLETRFLHADGRTLTVQVRAVPLRDAEGRIQSVEAFLLDVTEQRRAEAALAEQVRLYASLMETSLDAVHVVDRVGNLRYWNPAFLAHLGYPEEEARRLRVADWDVQWSQSELEAMIDSLIREPRRFDTRHRRKDGAVRDVEINGSRIIVGGEEMLLAVARDVTEEVVATRALRASEKRFRTLFDLVPVGLLISDPEGRVIQVNPAFVAATGIGIDELQSDCVCQVLPSVGEDGAPLEAHQCPRERAMAELRRIENQAVGLRRRDGSIAWFQVSAEPVIDGELGSILAYMDITERKRVEDTLRESEARFRTVVEESPVALFVHRGGRFLYLNSAAAALLGCRDAMELVGQPLLERVHPDDREAVRQRVGKSMAEGTQAPRREERLLRMDGSVVDVEVLGRPIQFLGSPAMLVFAQDIRERKRFETSEARAQKAESLVLMAGSIAHDFNNLFQALTSSLDLAEFHAKGDPEVAGPLRIGRDVLRRAVGLSWKMLDFSGRAMAELRPVSLTKLVDGWRTDLESTAGGRDRLSLELQEVPQVEADPARLWSALSALVENAREAMDLGGRPEGRVRIRLYTDWEDRPAAHPEGLWPANPPEVPATVCLEVEDEGPGAGPDVVNRMFDPFFTTRELGRGLGLPAALGILQGHRAGLHLLAGRNGGLRFRMHFPPAGS